MDQHTFLNEDLLCGSASERLSVDLFVAVTPVDHLRNRIVSYMKGLKKIEFKLIVKTSNFGWLRQLEPLWMVGEQLLFKSNPSNIYLNKNALAIKVIISLFSKY